MDGYSVPLMPQQPPYRQLTCLLQVRVTSQPSGYGSRAPVFQEREIAPYQTVGSQKPGAQWKEVKISALQYFYNEKAMLPAQGQ